MQLPLSIGRAHIFVTYHYLPWAVVADVADTAGGTILKLCRAPVLPCSFGPRSLLWPYAAFVQGPLKASLAKTGS